MREVYCDIAPHADGWTYTLDSPRSARYPTFEMAFDAAVQASKRERQKREAHRIVLRRLDLNGQKTEISKILLQR